jgi:hypothetical protein
MNTERDIKKARRHDRLSYLLLGVCLDYFLFRPATKLKPLIFVIIGVVIGTLSSWGIENIVKFIKQTLSLIS